MSFWKKVNWRNLYLIIGEGNGNPLQYSCLEKSHGRRSVIGYSPWGHKESDTAGRCHFQLDKELPGCGEQVHPVLTLGLTQSKLKSLTNVDWFIGLWTNSWAFWVLITFCKLGLLSPTFVLRFLWTWKTKWEEILGIKALQSCKPGYNVVTRVPT